MPLRVKSKPVPGQGGAEAALRTPSPMAAEKRTHGELPDIEEDDTFREVVKQLSVFIVEDVQLPSTFEQLRTTSAGDGLRALVEHLSAYCTNPAIVNALLALKWHYGASNEDKSLSEARANACEIVAWRFLTHLSEREAVEYCLYEIPDPADSLRRGSRGGNRVDGPPYDEENGGHGALGQDQRQPTESTALLNRAWSATAGSARRVPKREGGTKRYQLMQSLSRLTMSMKHDSDGGEDDEDEPEEEDDPTAPFKNLNALEIAAIADAKRFLSQGVVQKIITGIWNGDIIFWDELSIHTVKKPRFYNHSTADPFSRLRVPKYLKSFEVVFFASFLCLYYAVLVERDGTRITFLESLLYVWFAAFFYDELSEWIDAGSIFYAADVWNLFDMIMIGIGLIFLVMRAVGLSRGDAHLVETSFDVLSLEALFMVPRISSILSLSPYWGTLIPCLKEMAKDFVKFMVLVVIIYLGFLTTFSLVARESFTLSAMTMILTKIFFGSSYVGFDIMSDIDPVFGPPLMLLFITLSSILLMGSLTGMLSNSFSRVISHAREEYLYVYSVYVLEASTSNRLTHFYPPFNLVALVIFRPLRLFLPSDNKFRAARIALLKATHWPVVAVIKLYELVRGRIGTLDEYAGFKGPRQDAASSHGDVVVTAGGAAGSSRPPRKRLAAARPSLRTRRSGSYRHSPRPISGFDFVPPRQHLGVRHGAGGAGEDTELDAPTDVEVRILELSTKIDKLTELVLALQEQRDAEQHSS